jgi:RpiR family carbohydrate utilization transcriptional regulator
MAKPKLSNTLLQGSLLERIDTRYDILRKSERIVADHLRQLAGTRIDQSITELGKTIGVSEATISRVSRALGYTGFQDMKLSMAEGAGSRSNFANIPIEIDESDSLIQTSSNLANLLSVCLQGTQRMLDGGQIEAVVAAFLAAEKIVFVGVGGAAAICQEAAHMFSKAGLDAIAYSDGYSQIIAAANLGSTSVMVGVSHTGTTQTVADALTVARENKCVTIAIISDPETAVGQAAEIALVTWNAGTPSVPLYGDFIEGRISQLFLIDLLYLGVLFKAGPKTSHHLSVTASALERYYNRVEDRNLPSP